MDQAGGLKILRAKGKLKNLDDQAARAPAEGRVRHRAHALGDARQALGRERAPARRPAAWRWCTTASSRTTSSSRARADGQGPRVLLGDRHRDRRPPGRPTPAQPAAATCSRRCARRSRGCAAPTPSRCVAEREPDAMVVAKNASPLVLGLGDGRELRCASDVPAILAHTRDVIFLEDGEMAVLTPGEVAASSTPTGAPVERAPRSASTGRRCRPRRAATSTSCSRRSTSSRARVEDTLRGRVSLEDGRRRRSTAWRSTRAYARKTSSACYFVACGTTWHAALVGPLTDRGAGAHPRRRGAGERVPLPRSAGRPGRPRASPSRSRARPPTRWRAVQGGQGARRAHPRGVQRGGPRHRRARRTARSTRTRARRSAWPPPRPSPRSSRRSSCSRCSSGGGAATLPPSKARELLAAAAAAARADAERTLGAASRASRRSRRRYLRARDVLFLGRGPQLPDRARGRAQAQGDLVHPRRGLRRRRDEARADRAHRRGPAGGGRVPRSGRTGRALREGALATCRR